MNFRLSSRSAFNGGDVLAFLMLGGAGVAGAIYLAVMVGGVFNRAVHSYAGLLPHPQPPAAAASNP